MGNVPDAGDGLLLEAGGCWLSHHRSGATLTTRSTIP